ncbi:MAG: CoA transferase subunit A [Caldisericia bacterium]|jgi:acetate CoA/acetoacetate CoA-transferase alpha subunit|nr:CoA transferase subunit A [Caldisericia bacterium]
MFEKVRDPKEALLLSGLKDGSTLLIAGFLANGTSEILIDAILDLGVRELTVICNDTSYPDKGVGKLIKEKRVKKVITTHIGTNPETQKQYINKEIEVEFVPQGTLIERLRAYGAGLGGILTPVGVGTVVEEGKQKFLINGKEYLLELPLGGDISIIKAKWGDKFGNLKYYGTARNFNPVMALAGKKVIAEVENLVEIGEMNPNEIETPGIFIDYIVKGGI